jgi:cytochrome c-type biogenesis protein CcmH/NrfG
VIGQVSDAEKAITQAVTLRPNDVDVRLALAEVQLDEIKDGSLTPAFIQNMRAVLALAPKNIDSLYYVGKAEANARHPDKARILWKKAISLLSDGSQEKNGIQRELDALGNKK